MFPSPIRWFNTRRDSRIADAYILDVAARATRDEYTRHLNAFDAALAEMDLARLTTEAILDNYLAGVLA
jgi:hypothetical protein